MKNRELTVHDCLVRLCDACLDGEGGECHTPGCAMWLNRAPDSSLRKNPFVQIEDASGGDRKEIARLVGALNTARAGLDSIAALVGRCGVWDAEAEADCELPATVFEANGGLFGTFNRACEKHAEQHREEIRRAMSKGCARGQQAPIEDESAAIARRVLAAIATIVESAKAEPGANNGATP